MEHAIASVLALRDAASRHAKEAQDAARSARMWREIATLLMVAVFFQWVVLLCIAFGRL